MGFFDKLKVNAKNAGKTIEQKAKNLSEANKLNTQLKAEERNIQQNLIAIGQKYYDLYKESPDEEFQEMVEAIIKSEQKIDELKQEIEAIRAREPELDPIPEEATITEPVNTPAEPSAMVCMNCGNTYEAGNTFCAVCGQKLTAQYADSNTATNAPVQTENDVQVQQEVADAPEEEIVDAIISENEQEPEITQGDESDSKQTFCPYCGNKLNVSGQLFCGECGKAL
ncbi:MAG: zinc ribbon domain-containing protein [Oscillospiraceae bacterium]|nr:zinc ribbon domain-containing protein [Oscillospiraceae bacterium]